MIIKKGRFWVVWAMLLIAATVASLIAPSLSQYHPQETALQDQFSPPDSTHVLGTDHAGRDVFTRLLFALRRSVLLAGFATVIAAALGVLIGGVAGMVGGTTEWLFMRAVDVLLAFPGLLLALALIAILDSGGSQAALAVGISLSPLVARLTRAAVLSVKSRQFVEVSRSFGANTGWVLNFHILPNIAGQFLAFMTVVLAYSLLNFAALDFLGVTGSPTTPTLGRMLASGRTYLRVAPWLALAPGITLTMMVVAVTGLSNAWQQALPGHGH